MIDNINRYIDHTLLKANAKKSDIINLCEEAKKYNFYAVCVNPCYVKLAKELLINTNIKVCTVIGFPLGQNTTSTKVFETQLAIKDGADEVDVVINVAKLLDNDLEFIESELNAIKLTLKSNVIMKVIIETSYLSKEDIYTISQICEKVGVDYIKTSTGFGTRGANIEDILNIKNAVKSEIKIKASGGIKTREQAEKLIEAGASRIGTSSGVKIVNKEN